MQELTTNIYLKTSYGEKRNYYSKNVPNDDLKHRK